MEIKSTEFFRNMKTLPPPGTEEFRQLIKWEEEKILGGVNINGVYISGWLYWHLNHWWIRIDDVDEYGNDVRKECNPELRDNEWIRAEALEKAKNERKGYIEIGGRQGGKALSNYEPLITDNGTIPIGEAKIGDKIYDSDGNLCTINNVFPQGIRPVYRMHLADGRYIDSDINHKWEVFDSANRRLVKTTEELIKGKISFPHKRSGTTYKYSIKETEEVQFSKKELPIPPYVLGALLGDGGTTQGTNTISTVDEEILTEFRKLLPEYEIKYDKSTSCKYTIVHKEKEGQNDKRFNPLNQELIKLNLKCKSPYKFIPEIYKYSSVEDRYELVRGILDTDGSISSSGHIELKTSSKKLAEDFMWVLRSLGIQCRIGILDMRNIPQKMHTGQITYTEHIYYRVYVKTDKSVFKLKRKLDKIKPLKRKRKTSIVKLEYLGEFPTTCITVDNSSHLFLTKDFIVTHNSEMEASYFGMNAIMFQNTQNVIVCGNDNDLSLLKDKVDFGLRKLWKGLAIPRLDKTWRSNQVRLGYKTPDGDDKIWSYIIIRNAKDGHNTEVAAGTTAKSFIMDEVGKYSFSSAFKAAEPAFKGKNGWRAVPILVGCLTAGNKVFTKEGDLVNIETLKNSDGIIGYDILHQKTSNENITHINPPQEKECYKLITNKGTEIECSHDHPILIKHRDVIEKRKRKLEFVEIKDLKIGQLLCLPSIVPLQGKEEIKDAYFVGAIIGDGNYSSDRGIRFYNEDDEIWDYINNIGKEYSIFKSYLTKNNKLYREARIKGGMNQLKELGIYGQSGVNKDLPINIHRCNKETVTELIAGLFDTDGCIMNDNKKNNYITITSSSEKMIDSLKLLLLRIGIQSNKTRKNPDNRNRKIKSKNYTYLLDISDRDSILKFAEQIPLKIKRKKEKLNNLKEYFKNKKSKIDSNYPGIRFEKIKSIEYVGTKPVYNLTTSDTHTYLANGIITHNTGGSFDNGKDAENFFYNPESNNFLTIENEDNSKTGLFLSGLYRQDCKYKTTLADYLINVRGMNLPDVSELSQIEMWVSDKEKALKLIEKERVTAKLHPDRTMYLKQVMYFPITVNECFLSASQNIFDVESAKHQKARLLAQEKTGTPVVLYNDGEKITHRFTDKLPITNFPLKTDDSKDAPVVIYEFPIESPPYGLYVAGCLLPGEKVSTEKGLMNVEDVTLDNKLVNIEGELVNIHNLQRYLKKNEDVYSLRLSNNTRKTIFTKEHPIYISDEFYTYFDGKNKSLDETKFKFDFVEIKDVKKGQWVKTPNRFIEKNNFDINIFWSNVGHRIDRHIKSPLYSSEFWWFVGLFLGDGWVDSKKNKITVSCNIKEEEIIDRLYKLINQLFNRSASKRVRNNCVEISFSCKQLSYFLNTHFKKYASGKSIPDWAKKIDVDSKQQLVQGYLDSDGCITYDKKRDLYGLDFVSINLPLLEDIQDVLFSLGHVSGINILRKESVHDISGKISKTKEAYQLRVGHHHTISFLKEIISTTSYKMKKVDLNKTNKNQKRNRKGCFISNDKKYIYFQIKDIEKSSYSGWVYNFECDTHTYMCKNIPTHNCDPYRQGQSKYSNSLGSVYIYKRMHDLTGEKYQDMFVASYCARPEKKETWDEQARLLIKYYNARALVENDEVSFIDYMIAKGDAHYLEKQPDWLKEVVPNTTVRRDYGIHRSAEKIRDFLHTCLKKYLEEPIFVEKDENGNIIREILGVTKIFDPVLLEEIIQYNDEDNFDRVIAAELAIAQAMKMDPIFGKISSTKDSRMESLLKPKKRNVLFDNSKGLFTNNKNKLFR